MSERRCPNCGCLHPSADAPCCYCGWLPLQPTEVQFLEDPVVTCPQCREERPAGASSCPHCGSQDVLERAASNAFNFKLSTLFLLTVVVAGWLVLAQLSIPLAILAAIIFGFALLRTALLVRERKRFRYPISMRDTWRMLVGSMHGIIVALLVYGITVFGMGLFLGSLATSALSTGSPGLVALLAICIGGIGVLAFYLVLREHKHNRTMAIGTMTASLVAVGSFATAGSLPVSLVVLLLLLAILAVAISAIILACRRNSTAKAKPLVIGFLGGLNLCSVILLLLFCYPSNRGLQQLADVFLTSGILLWPTLLGVMTLEQMWSWDDAFPKILSRTRRPMFTAERHEAMAAADSKDGGDGKRQN